MKIKITDKAVKIIEYFFSYPSKKTYLRELSRETGVSHTWVKKIVHELAKGGLIKCQEKLILELQAYKDSEKFKNYKRAYNLFKIYDSGLVDFLTEEFLKPNAIVLFGSYCYGEDTEQSDIDIAIITNRKDIPDLHGFEKKLNRKISITLLEPKKIKDTFLNSLANGIVLYGYLNII